MARKRSGGVLTRMRYPSARKRPRGEPVARRVVKWVGGGIALAALLFILGALGWRLFVPGAGVDTDEGIFEVVRIEDLAEPVTDSSGETPVQRVAEIWIEIRGYEVGFRLTAEEVDAVRDGARLRVAYTYTPMSRLQKVTVRDWELLAAGSETEAASPETTGTVDPPPDDP